MLAPFIVTDTASADTLKQVICHRKGGGDGRFVVIEPANASSHIPKHISYDANGKIIASESDFAITIDTSSDALEMCKIMDPGVPHAPATVNFTDRCGTTNDTIGIPYSQYAYYTYNGQQYSTATTLSGSGTVTVKAVPKTYDFTFGGVTYHFPYTLSNPTSWTHQFTNEPCDGSLTIRKVTDPAGDPTPFGITVRNTTTNAVVSAAGDSIATSQSKTYSLAPGSYTVTEATVSGWHQSATTCATVTVVSDQQTTCTITNARDTGQLRVIKDVVNDNGGVKTYADFHFTINGGDPQSFEPTTDEDGAKTLTVPIGTYTIVEPEANQFGYTTSYDNCTAIAVTTNSTATCTITNNDKPATLIVKKILITDNGSTKKVTDFRYQIDGGAAVAFESDASNTQSVKANTAHSVSEIGDSGFETTYEGCQNIVIPNGGTATCTITNDDKPGTLIINKVVVNNNGGTAHAGNFQFIVDGSSPQTFTETSNPLLGHNELTVNAGTYTVTEPTVAGYTASYDACTNIVVLNGGTATCTITNDDDSPYLQLIKLVDNETNGGSATPEQWTLLATGSGNAFATSLSGTTGVSSSLNFIAGTYSLSENGPSGYTSSEWSCTNGVTATNAVINLVLGQSTVCTVTNTSIAPRLTLVKKITNDNGGTAAATDWTLTATGPTTVSGKTGDSAITAAPVKAGTYDLRESGGPSGYTASPWTCNGGMLDGATLTLDIDQNVTCTITNNDIAPTLTLVKHVTNVYGNTAAPTDWTLTATGPTTITGKTGDQTITNSTVKAGTYTLSESGPGGYIAGPWVCSGAETDGMTVHVVPGDTVVCAITNSDTPSYIKGTKFIVDADMSPISNQSQAVGWNIALYGSQNQLDWTYLMTTTTDKNGNFSFGNLAAGWYKLTESITDTISTISDSWTQLFGGNAFWVGVGQTVGTVKTTDAANLETNGTDFGNFENGMIGGYKWNDVNGNGQWDKDEATLTGWTIFVDANANGVLDTDEESTVTDSKGWYSFTGFGPNQKVNVCEVMQTGWRQTFPAKDDNCLHFTFTQSGQVENDYYVSDFGNQQLASLTIVKDAQPDSNKVFTFTTNAAKAVDGSNMSFGLTDDGLLGMNSSKTFASLIPGTYTVTEADVAGGWSLDSITCNGTGATMTRSGMTLSVTLANGAAAVCTFTNKFTPQVLPAEVVALPQPQPQPQPKLVNTGTSAIATSIVAMSFVGTAVLVAMRRKQTV